MKTDMNHYHSIAKLCPGPALLFDPERLQLPAPGQDDSPLEPRQAPPPWPYGKPVWANARAAADNRDRHGEWH